MMTGFSGAALEARRNEAAWLAAGQSRLTRPNRRRPPWPRPCGGPQRAPLRYSLWVLIPSGSAQFMRILLFVMGANPKPRPR